MTASARETTVGPRTGDSAEGAGGEREDGWYARRLVAGAVAGAAGAIGLYVVLAVAAVAEGRGAAYPFHAVQALMSGGRVLPEDPGRGTGEPQAQDVIVGPVLFLLPGVLVALAATIWAARRAETALAMSRVALVPAVVLTAACFLLFVVLLGFRSASPEVQRVSSGFGVRQLGMTPWVVGHVVYLVVMLAVLGPVARALEVWRKGRTTRRSLRGERARAS